MVQTPTISVTTAMTIAMRLNQARITRHRVRTRMVHQWKYSASSTASTLMNHELCWRRIEHEVTLQCVHHQARERQVSNTGSARAIADTGVSCFSYHD
jgi:methylthioribose-1-phosphate isomerase